MATKKKSTPKVTPARDKTPVLESLADTAPVEGVNVDTLPAFRSLQGLLPSARMHVQIKLMELAKDLPTDDEDKISELLTSEPERLGVLIDKMESLVLENAKDRADMEKWLISHDGGAGINALFYAFGKLTDILGN